MLFFYLIELCTGEGFAQSALYFGIASIHLATGYSYYYWAYLNSDANRMQCLNFLFIPNTNDLCNYYDLDLKSTKDYLKKADKIRYLIIFFIFSIQFVIFAFVGRFYYLSFFKINFILFIFVSTPCAILTFMAFHCQIFKLFAIYGLLFTAMHFLSLRASNVSKKILKSTQKYQLQSRKVNSNEFELIKEINSIILQFKDANKIFDSCITFVYLNVLICSFIFPSFLFVNFSFPIKILIICLNVTGLYFAGKILKFFFLNSKRNEISN